VTFIGRRPSSVPREALGQARLFVAGVTTADNRAAAAINEMLRPAQRMLERRPTLRKETVAALRRAWETMPGDFVLSRTIEHDRRGLRIAEHRICVSKWRDDRWVSPAWEPGISVVYATLNTGGSPMIDGRPVACICLHGIARWFERSAQRDVALLVRDIRALISVVPPLPAPMLSTETPAEVACPGGFWRGKWSHARQERLGRVPLMLNIRTFVDDQSVPDRDDE
jgi:hypothetical protein